MEQFVKSDFVFIWCDLEYIVFYFGGQKKLFNKVSGYVKFGVMVVFMGVFGVGKFILFNMFFQWQMVGVVFGDMFVNGCLFDFDFQCNIGFCF